MNAQSAKASRSWSERYAWFVVLILFLLAVVSYTDRYVLTLLVDPIRREFKVTDLEISLLLGVAFALVYGILGVLMGGLADRFNRRNLIVAGIITWSLATIACGLAPSYGSLFVSRMVVGLGEAGLTPAAISLIGDYFVPERRGAAVGFYLIGVPLGGGLANVIGGAVLGAVNTGLLHELVRLCGAPWRAVLVILGAPGLLLALAVLLVREPPRQEDVVHRSDEGGDQNTASPVWRRVAPMLVGVAGVSLAVACVIAWGPSVLIRKFHLAPSIAGVASGLSFGLGGGCGVLLGGVLGDLARRRGGKSARIWLCVLGAAIAAPCASFGLTNNLVVTFLLMTVFISSCDLAISSGIASLLDNVPNRLRGRATSITFLLNVVLGAGLGPTLVSLVQGQAAQQLNKLGTAILSVTTPVLVVAVALFVVGLRGVHAPRDGGPKSKSARLLARDTYA